MIIKGAFDKKRVSRARVSLLSRGRNIARYSMMYDTSYVSCTRRRSWEPCFERAGSVFARARALIARPKPFVYVKAAYTREGSRMRAGSLQMLNPRARQVLRKREERTSARSPRVPAHARSFEIRVFRIHARSLHARAHFRMIACFRNANKTT